MKDLFVTGTDTEVGKTVLAATLTAAGAFVGTLTYASPEAAEGRADHRSDHYSLGVTLYHMLVGQPPFAGGGSLPQLVQSRYVGFPANE